MSDNPLSELLGQLLSTEKQAASGEHEDDNQLAESLKALAGRSGGPLEEAVNGFLGGKGILYEAARTDATRTGSGLTQSDVTTLLTKQFGLPAAAAAIIAALVIKLLPSIGKQKKDAPAKKKKTSSKPKKDGTTKKASSKKAKAKKKAEDKPKASTSKPAAKKKKPSTSKKTSTKAKPKRRTEEIPAVEEP